MKKKSALFKYILLTALLLFVGYTGFKLPSFINKQQEFAAKRWDAGCKAWGRENYAAAYKNWKLFDLQLKLVRRPAKFIYWQAKALEKMGNGKAAKKLQHKLLAKYPTDYYAFLTAPSAGGITEKNKEKLLKNLSKKFQMPYPDEVARASEKSGIKQPLIWAVMKRESKFNPAALSNSGAQGLMQLMPATADYVALQNGIINYDLRSPADNIMLGALQLKALCNQFDGNVVYALAAYNAGASNVNSWRKNRKDTERWVEDIPFIETREFVRCVMENFAVYEILLRNNL